MPSRDSVEAFVAQVLAEDHVGAIRDWYAQDASMQENQDAPRVGRETLMAGEAAMLARVQSMKTELVAPPAIGGDHVAIRWRFTSVGRSGTTRVLEEVAWQEWRGEQIWREVFFYDPRQMTG